MRASDGQPNSIMMFCGLGKERASSWVVRAFAALGAPHAFFLLLFGFARN